MSAIGNTGKASLIFDPSPYSHLFSQTVGPEFFPSLKLFPILCSLDCFLSLSLNSAAAASIVSSSSSSARIKIKSHLAHKTLLLLQDLAEIVILL